MEQDEMIMFPYVVHESDMAREERKQRRLWLVVVLQVILIGVIICQKFISVLRTSK